MPFAFLLLLRCTDRAVEVGGTCFGLQLKHYQADLYSISIDKCYIMKVENRKPSAEGNRLFVKLDSGLAWFIYIVGLCVLSLYLLSGLSMKRTSLDRMNVISEDKDLNRSLITQLEKLVQRLTEDVIKHLPSMEDETSESATLSTVTTTTTTIPLASTPNVPKSDEDWIKFATKYGGSDQLSVDKKDPSPKETAIILEQKYPNIPYVFMNDYPQLSKKMKQKSSCAAFPDYLDLKFDTPHWQLMEKGNVTYYLYSAFLDVRKANGAPSIKILLMKTDPEREWKPFCQIWFNGFMVTSQVDIITPTYRVYEQEGPTQGFIYNCRIPEEHRMNIISGIRPLAVSMVPNECETASNILKVTFNHPSVEGGKREGIGVCSKALHYPLVDVSARLVEWVEMLHIFGVRMIYIYNFGSHPNNSKVLNYYEDEKKMDVRIVSLPGKRQNEPIQHHRFMIDRRRRLVDNGIEVYLHETIPRDDCLMRNMYRYEYVAYLDPDEVITPFLHENWNDMMKSLHKPGILWYAFEFRSAIFEIHHANAVHHKEAGIPENILLLNYVERCRKFAKVSPAKSFFNPELVVTYDGHRPTKCFKPDSKGGHIPWYCGASIKMDTNITHLNHYRNYNGRNQCVLDNDFVTERRIWHFKDKLIPRVSKAYFELGLYKNTEF